MSKCFAIELPASWQLKRAKFLLTQIEQGWSPQCDAYPAEPHEWGVLKVGCVNGGRFVYTENKRLPDDLAPIPGLEVRPGDVLMSRANTVELLGSAAYVAETRPRLLLCDKLYRLRFDQLQVEPRYMAWFFNSSMTRAQLEPAATGASNSMQNVAQDTVTNLLVPVPPLPDQRVIVEYLDRETMEIDSMVAAKERLLRLLAEKRRALITHAVTRGLDPHVPLRDSGIEWLGRIPAHWQVHRLKFHLSRIEQGWSPQCLNVAAEIDEWGVLKAGCVNGPEFDANENKKLPDDLEPIAALEVRNGDVLMSRSNTVQLLGSTALVQNVRPKLILCDKLYRLSVKEDTLHKPYLVQLLRSAAGRFEFERDATGASNSMQNIGQDSVRNVWLPIPPLREQVAVFEFISAHADRLDALCHVTQRSIDLLRERRAAVVAAAITGNIDVEAAA